MTSWSRTALRRPSRVSHSWRCAQRQPPVAYFPPAKPLQQQGPPWIIQLFGSARPKRRILKELQRHPPGTRAVSGEIKLLAAPSCRRVIETKSGQNMMFDPGGSQGRLRACPFLGTWRTLLHGEVMRVGAAGDDLQCFFWLKGSLRNVILENKVKATRPLCFRSGWLKNVMPSRATRGYRS